MLHRKPLMDVGADIATAASGAAASFGWMVQLNDGLQIIATAIAIVAGLYAIKWHKLRIKSVENTQDIHDESDSTGPRSTP